MIGIPRYVTDVPHGVASFRGTSAEFRQALKFGRVWLSWKSDLRAALYESGENPDDHQAVK